MSDEPELPTHEQIRKMADELREMHKSRGLEPDADAIVAALIHGGLTPPLLVRDALKTHWPAASEAVYISTIDAHRALVMPLTHRDRVATICDDTAAAVVEECEDDGEQCRPAWAIAESLLDEWDAVHFPRQVPEPRRVAALARLRRAGITVESLTQLESLWRA
jgi:hypothetical protein